MSGLDSSPGATGEESLSPLEQEVLDEYVRLAGNLGDVRLSSLSDIKQNIIPILSCPSRGSLYNKFSLTISRTYHNKENSD